MAPGCHRHLTPVIAGPPPAGRRTRPRGGAPAHRAAHRPTGRTPSGDLGRVAEAWRAGPERCRQYGDGGVDGGSRRDRVRVRAVKLVERDAIKCDPCVVRGLVELSCRLAGVYTGAYQVRIAHCELPN